MSNRLYSQKKELDTSVFREWPLVGAGKISDNGKYISYKIYYYGFWQLKREELVIQDVFDKWKLVLPAYLSNAFFSPDSRRAFVSLPGDTLAVYQLGTDKVSYITNIASCKYYHNYVIYTLHNEKDVLHVRKLGTQDEMLIDRVSEFVFNEKKNAMIICRKDKKQRTTLSWFDLQRENEVDFWEGEDSGGFVFDNSANSLAFIGRKNEVSGIWIYDTVDKVSQLLVDDKNPNIDSSFHITEIRSFSGDDQYIFFLSTHDSPALLEKKDSTSANVEIWKYSDVMLRSEQRFIEPGVSEYLYAVNISSKKVLGVSFDNERLQESGGSFALISKISGKGDLEEKYWNPDSQLRIFLLSLSDGHRRELFVNGPLLSRGGKYVLYFNPENRDFYTYETISGKVVNITQAARKINNTDQFIEYNGSRSYWLDNDSAIILFANNDIWKLDPKGIEVPINLTNGFGEKNNIVFHPINDLTQDELKHKSSIILMGFNQRNKDNGFYRISWNERKDPEKLIMDGHVYYNPRMIIENSPDKPVKALQANVWLTRRMSERESPNFFITTDFKKFKAVSNIYPERKYNWLTTQLHRWKTFEGDSSQGILYKPENFDSTKKYPIIFYFYNQFARNLHAYLIPGVSIGPLNIPWYVSHGYLVFVPDILYKVGETGPSAYNSVVSAAMYMKGKSYVDSSKMGIQGHSFGGYQANYIITRTGIFSAACSSSGITDVISFAGGFGQRGTSNHWMSSGGQLQLGVRLWDDPQRYIRNSPLFYINNITTPLLIMHTTNDKSVAYTQAFELFTGLRQFRKKVWLLLYDGENHILRNERNSLDYTKRQFDFFNFYLKGMYEPEWMKKD